MDHRTLRTAIVCATTISIVSLGAWTFRYAFGEQHGVTVRVNRFTGAAQALCGDGWHDVKPDPFFRVGAMGRAGGDQSQAPLCMAPLSSGHDRK